MPGYFDLCVSSFPTPCIAIKSAWLRKWRSLLVLQPIPHCHPYGTSVPSSWKESGCVQTRPFFATLCKRTRASTGIRGRSRVKDRNQAGGEWETHRKREPSGSWEAGGGLVSGATASGRGADRWGKLCCMLAPTGTQESKSHVQVSDRNAQYYISVRTGWAW